MLLGLLSNMNMTPDMAVALVQQMGVTDVAALDLVRAIAEGGFSKPKIHAFELYPGVERTLPTEGTAVVITATSAAERVTVVITREPVSTNGIDSRASP